MNPWDKIISGWGGCDFSSLTIAEPEVIVKEKFPQKTGTPGVFKASPNRYIARTWHKGAPFQIYIGPSLDEAIQQRISFTEKKARGEL